MTAPDQQETAVIRFHYNLSPNPMKVALCLEELGLPYEAVPVDTRRGQQFAPEFLALNPNGKVPVLEEDGATVFDSNAILLHLAERSGRFLPAGGAAARGELLSWLMFVATGLGPYCGQAVHFRHFAPAPKNYAETRYRFEADRHFGILEARLARQPWILGEDYTIVDMAAWGWARMLGFVLGDDASARFPQVGRLVAAIDARPAAARVQALRERHAFKQDWDAEARAAMFRHMAPAA